MQRDERAIARYLSEEVRRVRTERGWSQAKLAELLDLSVNYVSLLERGERLPSTEVLVRTARVLGVSVATLLGERAAGAEPWEAEALSLLRAVPEAARGWVLAMLRGIVNAGPTRPMSRSRHSTRR